MFGLDLSPLQEGAEQPDALWALVDDPEGRLKTVQEAVRGVAEDMGLGQSVHLALIIGPYSPNLDVPVRTAAGIIEANMAAGRVPDDGFLLLASVPYDEIGVDRARAELKSRFLSRFAAGVIRSEFPELAGKMAVRTAVLDWRSRRLETLDDAD